MAAYQNNINMNPFLLDSAYMRMAMETNCFSQFYPPQTEPVTAMAHESDQNSNETRKQSSESSTVSVVDKLESCDQQVTQKLVMITPTDKKRKTRIGSCAQSKDAREDKGKKQKQSIGEARVQKSTKALAEKKKKADQEPPSGYIHVRARRGQATDSHSLAERVRREKISERMKILQKLVPGCDKVTGKALMLDEIINYVQSLQNQVEFLSMKLASLNPMFYDFGMDQDSFIFRTSEASECSPKQQQPTGFADTQPPATTITITNNSYNLVPTAFSHPQVHHDSASLLWDVEEQGQKFLNPSGFNDNLCSFN